jgi:TonB family protein
MKSSVILVLLFSTVLAVPQTQPTTPASSPAHLSPEVAAALAEKKVPAVYPEKARGSGIQGTVVVNVLISETGEVREATAASGDADLAQAAIDSIKRWTYKPYVVDGKPTPVETQVTFRFHMKAPPAQLSKGKFRDGKYQNEFFGISYPLSQDWVRGTAGGSQALLNITHIPVASYVSDADSFFALDAAPLSSGRGDAKDYLFALASGLSAENKVKQEGDIGKFEIAGFVFYRADFKLPHSQYQTIVCTVANGYVLRWDFRARSQSAMEVAVATLNAITKLEPAPPDSAPKPETPESSQPGVVSRLRVSSGVAAGMRLKGVDPVYPQEAKEEGIQGDVILSAVIDKQGNVVDLAVVTGPGVLVASAVSAVRRWKYRPYLLKGQPSELDTTIEVHYRFGR